MSGKTVAGGAWVQVVIDGVAVGLANQASYDEDWAVQPVNVLNYHGPVDYDSQGYSCNISLGTFVPENPDASPDGDGSAWPDGGQVALSAFLTTRSEVQSNNGKPGEYGELQFINTSTGEIVNQFRKVMLASNGTQVNPNAFVTMNMRFMAVERTI